MPTLLSINNYYYRRGGAEVVFFEQNRLFEEIGWTVVPFAMHHVRNLPSEWSPYFVDEIEFGSEYSFAQKLARAPKVIYSTEARRKVRSIIGRAAVDVAHAHNVYHHISPSIFGALHGHGVPTVLTLHDLKIACPAYKMLTHDGICERCKGGNVLNVVRHRCIKGSLALSSVIALEAMTHRLLSSYKRHVSRFIVPSRFYLEKLVEWGWPRDRFTYIPNFVDPTIHEPTPNVGDAFVYAGRLGPEKGLATLVKAAALSRQPVVIVGTGPEQAMLEGLVSQLKANVTFAGYQSGADLFRIISAGRALVLPSEWYENAPISVLEAYALARPVIGALIGGIPELIQEGNTGLTFASGNVEELAAAMQRMATMPTHQVTEMGMQGRQLVEQEFTPQHYRDRLLQLYAELQRSRAA